MRNGKQWVLIAIVLLAMMSMACGLGLDLPFNLGTQDSAISPEDVAVAATRAAEAAATAAAVAGEAGQMAATAVSQGDGAAATAIAAQVEELATSLPQAAASITTVEGSLPQKLANIQPDANGNFAVTITEADLSEFIAGQAGAIQTEAFSAQDVQFAITPEYLELTGEVTEPVALPLVVKLRPVVVGDRLQFELLSASAGILPLPESMLDIIETVANSEIAGALSGLPEDVSIHDATLGNGEFTISGRQN